jgi:hypothetical protein
MDSMGYDLAVVASIFAVGGILFGHFEERTPKVRRVAKFVLFMGLTAVLSATLGRAAVYVMLAVFFGAFVVIHGWWLPKQGVNGLTGEPRRRYYELRGWHWPE